MAATTEQNEALYTKLAASAEDLTLARRHTRNLLARQGDFGPIRDDNTDYWERVAFVTALVVSYGRVFSDSKGLPHFPIRLLQYTTREKDLHEELMLMRRTQYAHSDRVSHHVRLAKGPGVTAVHRMPAYSIPRYKLKIIEKMLNKLIANIETRQSELHEEIMGPW